MTRLRAASQHRPRPNVVAALVLLLSPLAAAASDEAFERGQSAGRVLLTLRSPFGCAIAVLNNRCRSDVGNYFKDKTDADFKDIPKIGPHPLSGLLAFVDAGDPAGLDANLAFINTNVAPATEWARSPRDAALFDAGTETILWPAALGNGVDEYLAIGPILDLNNHRWRIPPGTLPAAFDALPPSKSEGLKTRIPSNVRGVTKTFVAELDRDHPPADLLTFFPQGGVREDAIDGIAFSTLAELIDNPAWLAQADAQLFAMSLMNDLTPAAGRLQLDNDACRKAVTIDGTFDHDGALKACVTSTTAYLRSLPDNRKRAFYLGTAAAQTAYNAAVLRSVTSAAEYLHIVATFDDLDASIPAFGASRLEARGMASDDWKAQFGLSLRLVHELSNA
jgi:hypothetical protein